VKKNDLYLYAFDSLIFKQWHWFRWHFSHKLYGGEHPLAEAVVQVCLEVEKTLPGFAKGMIDRIASISGREKYEPHYEQLLQVLAELQVIRQVITYTWPYTVKFQWEPTVGNSKKNPELTIQAGYDVVGIEVKAPSLFQHIRTRGKNDVQLVTRNLFPKDKIPSESTTLPRDNPIKDFLTSANEKFESFKQQNEDFVGLLIIVWDDFIYEPITALLSPMSGLFTEKSFALDKTGKPIRFENVDGVVLIRHLHQLINATRDEPFIDHCQGPLDYGRDGEFPPKVFIPNPRRTLSRAETYGEDFCKFLVIKNYDLPDFIPSGRVLWKPRKTSFPKLKSTRIGEVLLNALQAHPLSPDMGAEYMPGEYIGWLKF
jgi:hypothetical protein